jgi:hypothetical protein
MDDIAEDGVITVPDKKVLGGVNEGFVSDK